MVRKNLFPDFVFESSWEVCNKVGGIYTVLSTRAKTMREQLGDSVVFIGPDCWRDSDSPFFIEDESIFQDWHKSVSDTLKVKVGRWNVPGNPIAILVDFQKYYAQKNDIYAKLWESFGVDSLHAYGDYDEASMFSYAAALVVESLYHYYLEGNSRVVYHGNEWMTGLGLLYIHKAVPEIATIFTTHATSIGRSIAGNNKPLYQYLPNYNGDQMAGELNMQSKHSIEKQTAKYVDCFTTVSDITATECKELLDKPVDAVLPNGFEDDFVPKGASFNKKRKAAREKLLKVANALTGREFDDTTMIVATSGRYEFRNKGIDVFIDGINRLVDNSQLKKKVVAFIEVPAWVKEPRKDLQDRLKANKVWTTPLYNPRITHWLNNMNEDRALGMMNYLNIHNQSDENVTLIFVPCYLIGDDGIFNMPYYDLILGNDLSVYPSYYEPWGYTPLESVAFKVPCITTDLSGFGLWANKEFGHYGELSDGVKVIHRTDYNYDDVANSVRDAVIEYSQMSEEEVKAARSNAFKLSHKALWKKFFKYYSQAYAMAFDHTSKRLSVPTK